MITSLELLIPHLVSKILYYLYARTQACLRLHVEATSFKDVDPSYLDLKKDLTSLV